MYICIYIYICMYIYIYYNIYTHYLQVNSALFPMSRLARSSAFHLFIFYKLLAHITHTKTRACNSARARRGPSYLGIGRTSTFFLIFFLQVLRRLGYASPRRQYTLRAAINMFLATSTPAGFFGNSFSTFSRGAAQANIYIIYMYTHIYLYIHIYTSVDRMLRSICSVPPHFPRIHSKKRFDL